MLAPIHPQVDVLNVQLDVVHNLAYHLVHVSLLLLLLLLTQKLVRKVLTVVFDQLLFVENDIIQVDFRRGVLHL